jgi:hypothetical protein
MSGPALQMDDDKTIIPPNPLEHCRQHKIAQRQHITQTLRRLRDSDDMFLNNSITRAEDERTILDKDSNIWQSTLPTSSVAQQALVLPNGATMPPTVWAQHSTGRLFFFNKNKHVSFATHNEVHQYTNNEQHIMITYDFSANGHYISEKD